MIQAGIIGGAGFTAGELIRLLLHHKDVEINFVHSASNAGNAIAAIHQDLFGETSRKFTATINSQVDVLFLCLGHGNSKEFLKNNSFSESTKIIDLSSDFRLKETNQIKEKTFVYGLPELNKGLISKANYIANPGCFATAIQMAILPLAANKMLRNDVHVNAVTGATGAGVKPLKTTHFAWRDNNFSFYKPFVHQHLNEITQSVNQKQKEFKNSIHFLPNRGNFSRGIFATLYTSYKGTLEEAIEMYQLFYKNAPFIFVSKDPLHLKQVINTNKCLLHVHKHENMLLVTCILDNLLKGASGQAVQNMNLLFGFNETEGLKLKATYF